MLKHAPLASILRSVVNLLSIETRIEYDFHFIPCHCYIPYSRFFAGKTILNVDGAKNGEEGRGIMGRDNRSTYVARCRAEREGNLAFENGWAAIE